MKFTDAALDMMESQRWQPDPDIAELLHKEIRKLLHSGDLDAIYQLTPHNSERTRLIEEISNPRVWKALKDMKMARWEYPITCHSSAVSFALRAAKSLNDFKDAPYADELVPMRLYYDLDT